MWLDSGDYLEDNFFKTISLEIEKSHKHIGLVHTKSIEFNEAKTTLTKYHHRDFKHDQFYQYCFSINCFYHTFIINFDDYITINENFFFVDKPKHFGLLYDAQITFLMALSGCYMLFTDKTHSFYDDPHSVSRSKNSFFIRDNWPSVKKVLIAQSSISNKKEYLNTKKFKNFMILILTLKFVTKVNRKANQYG